VDGAERVERSFAICATVWLAATAGYVGAGAAIIAGLLRGLLALEDAVASVVIVLAHAAVDVQEPPKRRPRACSEDRSSRC